jgi:hypothetical protein
MIPVDGSQRAELTSDWTAYRDASGDSATYLVDLGDIAIATADGLHPTAAGHQSIYEAALAAFDPLVVP